MQLGPTQVPLVGQQAQIEQQAVAMTAQMIVSFAQQIALARIIRGEPETSSWADPPDAEHRRIAVDAVAAAIDIATSLAKANPSILAAAKSIAPLFRIQ